MNSPILLTFLALLIMAATAIPIGSVVPAAPVGPGEVHQPFVHTKEQDFQDQHQKGAQEGTGNVYNRAMQGQESASVGKQVQKQDQFSAGSAKQLTLQQEKQNSDDEKQTRP